MLKYMYSSILKEVKKMATLNYPRYESKECLPRSIMQPWISAETRNQFIQRKNELNSRIEALPESQKQDLRQCIHHFLNSEILKRMEQLGKDERLEGLWSEILQYYNDNHIFPWSLDPRYTEAWQQVLDKHDL